MAKDIKPANPNETEPSADANATPAQRKTAGASGRFRKLAVRKVGRKTNNFRSG